MESDYNKYNVLSMKVSIGRIVVMLAYRYKH